MLIGTKCAMSLSDFINMESGMWMNALYKRTVECGSLVYYFQRVAIEVVRYGGCLDLAAPCIPILKGWMDASTPVAFRRPRSGFSGIYSFPLFRMLEEAGFEEVRILVEQRAARAKRIVGKWISLEGRKKAMKIKPVVSLNRSGVGNASTRPVRFTDSVLAGHQMRKAMLKGSQGNNSNNIPSAHTKWEESDDSEEERLLKSKRRN